MRIASWNVNSFKIRGDHVHDWLTANQPDIVCLQELKGLDFPYDTVSGWGYHALAKGQKAYNGVAILSKNKLELVRDELPGANDPDNARFMDVDAGTFRVLGCYMPNGNPIDGPKFPYKLNWLEALHAYCAELRHSRIPFILLGDFNIIPEPLDAYNPAHWLNDALYQPESRALYRRFLGLGLCDTYRAINGNKQEYTFWDYQAGKWESNSGIRIDHILSSPTLTDALVQCTVDRGPRGLERPSDHTPIMAEFDLGQIT